MSHKTYRIAAVGDNCMDVYHQLDQAFPGGNPVNVAVYSVRLGLEASYTGVVGTDAYGKQMIDAIRAKGVDVSHLRVLNGATAITQVTLEEGNRIFGDYDEGVLADFKLTEADKAFLASHDMVVSGLWGMIEKDLPDIKRRDVPIAFDFATKWDHPIVEEALPYVDYAFFASDETFDDQMAAFMKAASIKGPKIVVVTLGEKGSVAWDGHQFYTFGIVGCEVVDTMGAGDSYIAGFLKGILEGLSIEACMAEGAKNSSVTLAYLGAW